MVRLTPKLKQLAGAYMKVRKHNLWGILVRFTGCGAITVEPVGLLIEVMSHYL